MQAENFNEHDVPSFAPTRLPRRNFGRDPGDGDRLRPVGAGHGERHDLYQLDRVQRRDKRPNRRVKLVTPDQAAEPLDDRHSPRLTADQCLGAFESSSK